MFDWKLGLFIFQLASCVGTGIMFTVIKFNDFKHLEKIVDELRKVTDDNQKILNKIDKKLDTQVAVCNERHDK